MCVIVHKERGIDLPSEEILQKCFTKNPDGSGILVGRKDSKIMEIHKGFMTFDDFKKAYKELNLTKDDEIVFHFRITTSGGTNPENCHPFPISCSVKDLKATRINTTRALVHNGVLGQGDTLLKISDTQVFVKDILSRKEISDYLDDEEVQKIINSYAGTSNKFFVADSEKGIFKRFGNWHKDEESGCFFSNSYWKSYPRSKSYINDYGYNNWGGYGYGGSGSSYYGSKKKIPDINTILCPYCDTEMKQMLNGRPFYICPDCAQVYNDHEFSMYVPKNGWVSIADINDFDTCCEFPY